MSFRIIPVGIGFWSFVAKAISLESYPCLEPNQQKGVWANGQLIDRRGLYAERGGCC